MSHRNLTCWLPTLALVLLLFSALTQAIEPQGFLDQCAVRIEKAYESKINGSDTTSPWPQFVGPNGQREGDWHLHNAWGITLQECEFRCTHIYSTFEFSNFSTSVTNWLLPWLALTAQLPYETSGPFHNVLSALLAVGSPALATYGMVLTLLHRFQTASDFGSLIDEVRDISGQHEYLQLVDRLSDAQYILQETNQAPMRISETLGWLSSLIVLPENQRWWKAMRKSLENTRRGVSISLIAQILLAVVAWIFTVISAFSDVGDVTTALSISSSSIWLWMVPVVIGFVGVGTQCRRQSVESALKFSNSLGYCTQPESSKPCSGQQTGVQTFKEALGLVTDEDHHRGILTQAQSEPKTENLKRNQTMSTVDSTICCSCNAQVGPEPRIAEDIERNMEGTTLADTDPNWTITSTPTRLSVRLSGFEGKEGPIFNFARVFTSWHFANSVERGFRIMIANIKRGRSPRDTDIPSASHLNENLAGNRTQVSRYCGFKEELHPLRNFPVWSEIPGRVWRNMLVAAFFAMVVLWGTTGPSILIAILTPAEGLGCRSGSYLLYGCMATASFLLLLVASLTSHAFMLRYESCIWHHGVANKGKVTHGILPIVTVVCEVLGSAMAALNAVWLLCLSVLELSGGFDTCWCQSVALTKGSQGWVLLFVGADVLGPPAQKVWVSGIFFLAVVCVISCVFIGLGCRQRIRNI